jgi:hypothetical protein
VLSLHGTRLCVQEIVKSKGTSELYMSIWDWSELEECRSLIYPSMAACDVRSRYERWGGLPRYVLEKTSDDDQRALSRAIDKASMRLVREAAFGSSPNPRVSDLLLHTVVANDFVTISIEWASVWVFEKVFEKMLLEERESLLSFVRVARGPELGELGALRGRLWEGLCHRALAQGGIFAVRRLYPIEGKDEGGVTIAPCEVTRFYQKLSEARAFNASVYLRPHNMSQPGIDSIRQPGTLYQITSSTSHGINVKGLKEAMEVMQEPAQVTLYFVVPEDEFDKFRVNGIKNLRAAIKKEELSNLSLCVMKLTYDCLRETH